MELAAIGNTSACRRTKRRPSPISRPSAWRSSRERGASRARIAMSVTADTANETPATRPTSRTPVDAATTRYAICAAPAPSVSSATSRSAVRVTVEPSSETVWPAQSLRKSAWRQSDGGTVTRAYRRGICNGGATGTGDARLAPRRSSMLTRSVLGGALASVGVGVLLSPVLLYVVTLASLVALLNVWLHTPTSVELVVFALGPWLVAVALSSLLGGYFAGAIAGRQRARHGAIAARVRLTALLVPVLGFGLSHAPPT